MLQNASCIFWDFNGTLLNDVSICVQSMNTLLQARNMAQLSHQTYKQVFGFPVKDYYEKIGFDFDTESFELLSEHFIEAFYKNLPTASLHTSASRVLAHFNKMNKQQLILSAMEQSALHDIVRHYQIDNYFTDILGIEDIYASSKVHVGEQYIAKNHIDTTRAVFIGDSTHDYEVATALGIPTILVADGHQSKERLEQTGAVVVNNLSELLHLD